MRKATSFIWLTLLVIGIGFSLGCPQGSDQPTVYPVTGTVTQGGTAVAGATVTFVPTGDGPSASGITDDSGKYALSTYAGGEGAVPGQFGVKIVKIETPEVGSGGGAGADQESAGYEAAQQAAQPVDEMASDAEPKNPLPQKYADTASSGLSHTVEQGDNTFDFSLDAE